MFLLIDPRWDDLKWLIAPDIRNITQALLFRWHCLHFWQKSMWWGDSTKCWPVTSFDCRSVTCFKNWLKLAVSHHCKISIRHSKRPITLYIVGWVITHFVCVVVGCVYTWSWPRYRTRAWTTTFLARPTGEDTLGQCPFWSMYVQKHKDNVGLSSP